MLHSDLYTKTGNLLILVLSGMVSIHSAQAQSPSYTIDSTTFLIMDFEGGHSEFEVADINDDGHNDMLCVGDHGSPFINTSQHGIAVMLGNGTSTNWTFIQEGDFGYGGIAVGDVNNDGFKDVGYGVHHNYSGTDLGDQVLEVVLGNGTATGWVPYDDSLGLQGQTYGMFGTDMADFDNDGLLDVGSNAFGCCDGLHLSTNNGDGTWSYAFGYTGGNSNHVFRFADFNNDGNVDFAVARQDGVAYFGDGTGFFQKIDIGLPPMGNFGADYVFAADTDGNGTDELGFCANGGIHVYKWNAALNSWQNASGILPATGSFYTMNLADLNNDGFIDVGAVSTSAFVAYLGNGANVWTQSTTVPIPNMNWPQAMTTGDLDHNGRPEILILCRFPVGWFNNINKLYVLNEQTVASNNSIQAITPYRDQCMPNNAVRFIKWQSEQAPGVLTRVNLELSLTGTNGVFDTIAIGLPDNGIYQWTVPAATSSPNCVIRFTQTDTTGLVNYSTSFSELFNIGCDSVSAIGESNTLMQFDLFPNPARDQVQIQLSEKNAGPMNVLITDISGRLTYQTIIDANHAVIDCGMLQSGTYFLVLVKMNEAVACKKFTIVRD